MKNVSKDKEMLIQSLSDFDIQTLSLAVMYANDMKNYGIDVTQTWQTAAENAYNLDRAYRRGFADAMNRMKEFDNESNRD